MTDQLSLSIWLDQRSQSNSLRHFEKMLRFFPFSQREQPQSVISIYGVASTEPPLLERPVNGPLDPAEIIPAFRDYSGADVGYFVDSWWDLWQFDGDWKLAPARVTLACFGPDFDGGSERESLGQEDLRIDFGLDSNYLPQPELAGSAKLIASNIRSLLRVVHEIDAALPVEKRKLETESGGNFAERLEQVLRTGTAVQ